MVSDEVKNEEILEQDEITENLADAMEAPVEGEVVEDQAQEHLNRLMRLQADFENYKRRTRIEKEEFAKYAGEVIIKGLLPVIDNLERALGATGDLESFKSGVEMIAKQLQDVLASQGLAEIEALGASFDPNYHQAVMQVEREAEQGENEVIEVFQKGYLLHNKVIRPAMVKVTQ